jgi:hypothetical protein
MCLWAEFFTPRLKSPSSDTFPFYFYVITYMLCISLGTINCFIVVSIATYFTRIADIRVGGTYFSLLFTAYNIGKTI